MNNKYNFFVFGNSSHIKTWSNVPYLLSQSFENHGKTLNRVNLHSKSAKTYLVFEILLWKPIRWLKQILYKQTSLVSYDFSLLNKIRIKRLIKKQQSNTYTVDFFINYSHAFRSKPSNTLVLFHDWNKEWEIKTIHKRDPDFFERSFIKKEREILKNADKIICIFPGFISYLEELGITKEKILYIGPHINIPLSEIEQKANIDEKTATLKLLFIGNRKFYTPGLLQLLKASTLLQDLQPEIWVIGFNASDIDETFDNVKFFGYLDKGIDDERDTYYNLLKQATFFINTTPEWGAFSSCAEAMYFNTPIIISKYQEFVNMMGTNIQFGQYIESSDENVLAEVIRKKYLNKEEYYKQATEARNAVKQYTWQEIGKTIIDFIDN